MHDFARRMVKRLRIGWFLPLVVLVLPNCTFEPRLVPTPTFTAVFCDIEKPPAEARHCASEDENANGLRLAEAAIALNRGDTHVLGLDDSPAALARCGGRKEAVYFQGPVPEGQPTCVDTNALTSVSAACEVPCQQFFGVVKPDGSLVPDNPPTPETIAFCQQRAHLSVNVPQEPLGYSDGCTTGGKLVDFFVDPRRPSEALELDASGQFGIGVVTTTDAQGLTHTSVSRSVITSPPANNPPFDAGAASSQRFNRGDGFVEFSAGEVGKTHVVGLSEMFIPALGCTFHACDDTDPSLADITFAISLNLDRDSTDPSRGRVFVIESGRLLTNGPKDNGSFETYAPGERFRVSIQDNSDGTGTVTYSKMSGFCISGNGCTESTFYTSQVVGHYPLRVDMSFREQGATNNDIRLVRIH